MVGEQQCKKFLDTLLWGRPEGLKKRFGEGARGVWPTLITQCKFNGFSRKDFIIGKLLEKPCVDDKPDALSVFPIQFQGVSQGRTR